MKIVFQLQRKNILKVTKMMKMSSKLFQILISLNVEQPDANEKFKTCSTQTEVINDAEIFKNICLKIKSNSLCKHLS